MDPNQIPRPQEWRNNLTALSQRYDLLFIAYGDEVHIFRPSFPEQKVPSRYVATLIQCNLLAGLPPVCVRFEGYAFLILVLVPVLFEEP